MDLHHILYTISYGLIILGLILLAPCFFKGCCAKAQESNGGGKKTCGILSWLCFMAGFILSIINVWVL